MKKQQKLEEKIKSIDDYYANEKADKEYLSPFQLELPFMDEFLEEEENDS